MTAVTVRAPATTANLGPGFDCAGAAFDLWNELEVRPAEPGEPLVELSGEGTDEIPAGPEHLALRAFALVAPIDGWAFRFVNRIPLERGLGSSAATVAAGLVAASIVSGRNLDADQLLALGLPLEGHADNLAAALLGGACLIWQEDGAPRARRISTSLPFDPVVIVPTSRVNTEASRGRLPQTLPYADAVEAAARAALLGAGIAAGDGALLERAFNDVLHEPYRMADAPLLADLRANPVPGSAGATLSGSGPTVVCWAWPGQAEAVAAELERRVPGARVLPLRIATNGTEAV